MSVVVTVSAAEGVRGLLLQGRRRSNNKAVGQFDVDSATTWTVSCDGADDTLVAWYGTQQQDRANSDAGFGSRAFTWMPPVHGAHGPLEFVCVTFSLRTFASYIHSFICGTKPQQTDIKKKTEAIVCICDYLQLYTYR